ncbi:uncharacterized protein LOC108253908 [Diaphorina citri]|uniref:Uncharacterized protein LOC108253908 n=1 Tax=Diaphorina citri TaxID=121845 RepID=A0A1S4EPV6_DIACI|nr:uncharacterized protein LOC108253908 [Diaphorina citri]XP_026687755.1 uncharacterized protein LOC108253908 [Diaphorina citri]
MYILLEFDEQSRKVVEAVPEKWVLSSNECFWPNGNSNFVQRMLKKQEIIPKEPFFRRVPYAAELGRFKSYLEARNMAKYYSDQETTVQSDEETFAQDVDPDYSNSGMLY